ncbi:hypothetical protein K502DRAFT_367829 [Neoconidiobolus thromboides FSU 785]|nr:hypothetical protein K502DRAFT_367829 [Neoconidiobolus thromboides FSU 785]
MKIDMIYQLMIVKYQLVFLIINDAEQQSMDIDCYFIASLINYDSNPNTAGIDPLELPYCPNCKKENLLKEKCVKGSDMCYKSYSIVLKPDASKLLELKKMKSAEMSLTKEKENLIERKIAYLNEQYSLK